VGGAGIDRPTTQDNWRWPVPQAAGAPCVPPGRPTVSPVSPAANWPKGRSFRTRDAAEHVLVHQARDDWPGGPETHLAPLEFKGPGLPSTIGVASLGPKGSDITRCLRIGDR
jgi:hypothetical protein